MSKYTIYFILALSVETIKLMRFLSNHKPLSVNIISQTSH